MDEPKSRRKKAEAELVKSTERQQSKKKNQSLEWKEGFFFFQHATREGGRKGDQSSFQFCSSLYTHYYFDVVCRKYAVSATNRLGRFAMSTVTEGQTKDFLVNANLPAVAL